MEVMRSPRFLCDPLPYLLCSTTPVRPVMPGIYSTPVLSPRLEPRRLPHCILLSRLNCTAFRVAVYASRTGSPQPMQDSLPVACHALPNRIGYLQGHSERFRTTCSSSFPRLGLAQSSNNSYSVLVDILYGAKTLTSRHYYDISRRRQSCSWVSVLEETAIT